jgi:rSAM/selenodomain-associated transferase 1
MPLSPIAVVLMTKYPAPGKVKTRLIGPDVSGDHAAAVHAAFLRHLVTRLARLNPAELVICFDPPDRAADMRKLFDDDARLSFLAQCEGDLGDRLTVAARDVGARHPRLLFMGVDSPDVPLAHLFKAAELTEEIPVSLSPTDDGGYWSLGLQRDVDAAALLAEIPWSSGREALATLAAADRLGLCTVTGLAWDDVDRPDDLRRLLTRLTRSDVPADRALLGKLTAALPPDWFV